VEVEVQQRPDAGQHARYRSDRQREMEPAVGADLLRQARAGDLMRHQAIRHLPTQVLPPPESDQRRLRESVETPH